jgi:hypothetical protein
LIANNRGDRQDNGEDDQLAGQEKRACHFEQKNEVKG